MNTSADGVDLNENEGCLWTPKQPIRSNSVNTGWQAAVLDLLLISSGYRNTNKIQLGIYVSKYVKRNMKLEVGIINKKTS